MATEDTDRAVEETLSARDRVRAAIRALGEAGPNAIHEACGGTLSKGTIKNEISKLRSSSVVEDTGDIEPGGGKVVRFVDSGRGQDRHRHHTFKGDDDDSSEPADTSTVAGLFANPPEWLPKQIEVYRKDPDRHLAPLCATVAAVVLGDSLRADEVCEEVEKILEEGTQG